MLEWQDEADVLVHGGRERKHGRKVPPPGDQDLLRPRSWPRGHGAPQGVWFTMMCAYGVPAHMIQLPVVFGLSDSPLAFGSNGHMIM